MRTSTTMKWFVSILLILSLSASFALAEDVTFRANVLNSANIHPGDTFQVQVFLDITAGKSIKWAEFQLTPSTNAQLPSASSGNMFTGATQLYGATGAIQGTGIKYGETTATDQDPVVTGDQGIEGNNKLFATVTGTATTAGSVTLTFSNLVAKKGAFQRTVTSLPVTFTIFEAQTCTPSCPAANIICQGTTDTRANGCGGNCNVAGTKLDGVCATCVPRQATCDQPGVSCTNNVEGVIPANGCTAPQTCNTNTHACEAVPLNECTPAGALQCSGNGYQTCGNYDTDTALEWSVVTPCNAGETCSGGVCSASAKEQLRTDLKTKVDQIVNAIPNDNEVPQDKTSPSFLRFISNLARSIKELFTP